jgi:hypothetical protein
MDEEWAMRWRELEDVLMNIKAYEIDVLEQRFELNNRPNKKTGIHGYHKLTVEYKGEIELVKGREIELQFQETNDGQIALYFIKFLK